MTFTAIIILWAAVTLVYISIAVAPLFVDHKACKPEDSDNDRS